MFFFFFYRLCVNRPCSLHVHRWDVVTWSGKSKVSSSPCVVPLRCRRGTGRCRLESEVCSAVEETCPVLWFYFCGWFDRLDFVVSHAYFVRRILS